MLSLKYFITSPNDRATPGDGGFFDLVILGQIRRVNMSNIMGNCQLHMLMQLSLGFYME